MQANSFHCCPSVRVLINSLDFMHLSGQIRSLQQLLRSMSRSCHLLIMRKRPFLLCCHGRSLMTTYCHDIAL